MDIHQRDILAKTLHLLEYPLLAKDAMSCNPVVAKSYAAVAFRKAYNLNRNDLIEKLKDIGVAA